MSATTTLTTVNEDLNSSGLLSQSVSSAGSPRRHSKFSKPFKQASQFFLTRRFSDALAAISPLITGRPSGHDDAEGTYGEHVAPVAHADRKWRVKIWSFYITLQNAILELGATEGKKAVGVQEWNAALNKARSGSIWEQVVNTGYQGDETLVDAEVVLNLANLLLAQSPDQKRNQDYIETYLSVAPEAAINGKEGARSERSLTNDKESRLRDHQQPGTLHNLEVQIEIIELFALHVLPQNGEWQYAKEFLNANEMLDEERKDFLLQALDDLEDEGREDSEGDAEDVASRRRNQLPAGASIGQIGRTDSNITVIPASTNALRKPTTEKMETKDGHVLTENHGLRPVSPRPDEPLSQPPSQPRDVTRNTGRVPIATKDMGRSSFLRRTFALYDFVLRTLSNTTAQLARNPAPLLRFVLFLIVLVGTFGRNDLRERLRRAMHRSLKSFKHTLGMGFKASSI